MKNIIIIGAGPAGLTAAYELLHSEKKRNLTSSFWKNPVLSEASPKPSG